MKRTDLNLWAWALLFAFCLTSCSDEKDDFGATTAVVKGTVCTTDGKPVPDVIVELTDNGSHHIAEGKTDGNGTYRLAFDGQETDAGSSFSLTFDMKNLSEDEYLMYAEIAVYNLGSDVLGAGKTYEQNHRLLRKRMMKVTVEGNELLGTTDRYALTNTVDNPNPGSPILRLEYPVTLQEGTEGTFEIPCALNDSNRIRLECREGSNGTYTPVTEMQRLFVTADAPVSVTLNNGWIPRECRFTLSVGTESNTPSAFEEFHFRIKGNDDEFMQPYDSIVWCAEGFPGRLTVYAKQSGILLTKWSEYFFRREAYPVCTALKGYRGGKVVYADSVKLNLFPRNFLYINWAETSINLTEASFDACSLLEGGTSFRIRRPMEEDGHIYCRVHLLRRADEASDAFLTRSETALKALMNHHLGSPVAVNVAEFLLPEGVTPVATWQTASTRAALLRVATPAEDEALSEFYIQAEAR